MAILLIVDDDNNIRATLHDLLAQSHECHTADRAEQALAYLDLQSYDAVLTDISMPGLSGREILRAIQDKHPTTPVIVISGVSDKKDAEELLESGAFAYVAKPFELSEIEDLVNRAIARHKELTPVASSNDSQPLSPADDNN